MRFTKRSQRTHSATAVTIAGCLLATTLSISMLFLIIGDHGSISRTPGISIFGTTSTPPDWCNKVPPRESASFTEGQFQSEWKTIDEIVALDKYKEQRVSGGLFLYPRQTVSLSRVVNDLIVLKASSTSTSTSSRNDEAIGGRGKHPEPFQVCETGFGAGHSAAFFLSISPNVKVLTFDKFDRPYQIPIVNKLSQKFRDRIQHVKGNSCATVPRFLENTSISATNNADPFRGCDFLHGSSLCPSDNIDLVQHAKCGTVLTSTAMHSLIDKDVYFGPSAQWRKLRKDGCITDITCFTERSTTLDRSFVFAAENTKISHKFCFAVVTGDCHYSAKNRNKHRVEDRPENCDASIYSARQILKNLCPEDRIEIPV